MSANHCLGCGAWWEDGHEEDCPLMSNDISFLMMLDQMDKMTGSPTHLSPSNKNALDYALGDRSPELLERLDAEQKNQETILEMIKRWNREDAEKERQTLQEAHEVFLSPLNS